MAVCDDVAGVAVIVGGVGSRCSIAVAAVFVVVGGCVGVVVVDVATGIGGVVVVTVVVVVAAAAVDDCVAVVYGCGG